MARRLEQPIESPYLVLPHDFDIRKADTSPPGNADKAYYTSDLQQSIKRLQKAQRVLEASDQAAVLVIFQAMDAAGKDGTIRAVMTGINPAGCQVYAFKKPSAEELDHDFLWRAWRCLPERGRIGIFNRSYYEEVLVVRVHPELLAAQRLPSATHPQEIWEERFESIREMEQHLHRNGTTIIKFFLHVSKEEQKKRLLARIEDSESNWKFQAQDVVERAHWDSYMEAYEAALTETSRKYAPWYVIPADNKAFMRACVADIIAQTIESLDLSYPKVGREEHKKLSDLKHILEDD